MTTASELAHLFRTLKAPAAARALPRLANGRPSGLIFPRRDGRPWRRTDVNNWRRRVWHPSREKAEVEPLPPYDLRHAFA
jgi:integrase